MKRIGFLINPVAGMGGTVGLKGTDNLYAEAVKRGAKPGSWRRALATMSRIQDCGFHFVTCSGPMGEDILVKAAIPGYDVVYHTPDRSFSSDTRAACQRFLEAGVEMILFCGGDGTARDLFDVVRGKIPILGIPAGVKMYSSVFAVSPGAAADIMKSLSPACGESPKRIPIRDTEVVDVDEEAYRHGELKTRLYGFAKSPYVPWLVQSTKQVFEERDEERAKEEISRFLTEVVRGTPEILYILGPGTTTGSIAQQCGIKKTLLGFDAMKECRLVETDLNEKDMLGLLDNNEKVRLVVSIIGAQGSVLGRGTQQVSPAVLKRIGVDNIIIIATPHKLQETPVLFFDTGDPDLDGSFGDFVSVISGYRVAQRRSVGRNRT
jgi:predicted polyphosphate/ATP-dependent NAD kinase